MNLIGLKDEYKVINIHRRPNIYLLKEEVKPHA